MFPVFGCLKSCWIECCLYTCLVKWNGIGCCPCHNNGMVCGGNGRWKKNLEVLKKGVKRRYQERPASRVRELWIPRERWLKLKGINYYNVIFKGRTKSDKKMHCCKLFQNNTINAINNFPKQAEKLENVFTRHTYLFRTEYII